MLHDPDVEDITKIGLFWYFTPNYMIYDNLIDGFEGWTDSGGFVITWG